MARKFRYTTNRRVIDWIMRRMLGLGFAPKSYYLLTVPGRKSGRLHSTPVVLIEEDDRRWLVVPYGPVNWVLNARTAGKVTLSKGKQSQVANVVEGKRPHTQKICCQLPYHPTILRCQTGFAP